MLGVYEPVALLAKLALCIIYNNNLIRHNTT